MTVIYKYDITELLVLGNEINIPCSAKFLSIQLDTKNDHMCMWYMVEPNNPSKPLKIRVFGTGHELPYHIDDMTYRGTVINSLGLVWHVFEERT